MFATGLVLLLIAIIVFFVLAAWDNAEKEVPHDGVIAFTAAGVFIVGCTLMFASIVLWTWKTMP